MTATLFCDSCSFHLEIGIKQIEKGAKIAVYSEDLRIDIQSHIVGRGNTSWNAKKRRHYGTDTVRLRFLRSSLHRLFQRNGEYKFTLQAHPWTNE